MLLEMPSIRAFIKGVSFRTLSSPFLLEQGVKKIARTGLLPILNFHRISDSPGHLDDAISPHVFDDLIVWLQTHFDIVTFEDMDAGRKRGKPPVILSFDDGYRDFAENAAPILRARSVKANVNIIPSCVESGIPPNNILIRDFIQQAPAALLRETPLPGLPAGADPDRRTLSGLRASAAFKNQPMEVQKRQWSEISPRIERYDGLRMTALMSKKDILQLADEVEFGAHSFEHATMNLETAGYLRSDAARCQSWWRGLTGRDFTIYAFPNGAAAQGQAEIVLDAGYKNVLLVADVFSKAGGAVHNRVTMTARSGGEARVRALGWPRSWLYAARRWGRAPGSVSIAAEP